MREGIRLLCTAARCDWLMWHQGFPGTDGRHKLLEDGTEVKGRLMQTAKMTTAGACEVKWALWTTPPLIGRLSASPFSRLTTSR